MITPEVGIALITATIGFVAKVKQIILDASQRQLSQDGKVSIVEGGEVSLSDHPVDWRKGE